MYDVWPKPYRLGKLRALRPAGEHRLGAQVDLDARDLAQPHLAADVRGTFQHRHVSAGPRGQDSVGSSEPADPPAYDDDVTLSPGLSCPRMAIDRVGSLILVGFAVHGSTLAVNVVRRSTGPEDRPDAAGGNQGGRFDISFL